jgi:HEAT repeat protein
LAELVRREVRVDVRVCAADALRRIGGTDAMRALRPALDDERYAVKVAAIKAVKALADRDYAPKLAQLARADPEPLIRAQAAEALGPMKDDTWVPLLESLVHHDRLTVALSASSGLIDIGSPAALKALTELTRSGPPAMRWSYRLKLWQLRRRRVALAEAT